MRSIRITMAQRNARTVGVRSFALHRPAPRRCRTARSATRQKRRRDDPNGEDWRGRDDPNLAASPSVARDGARRRADLYLWRSWTTDEEGVLFGNWFREVCEKAGVPGSAHGLRKAGATRAANNGATEAQLEAIFGWRGGGMAALYTREANRVKLAHDAASKLCRNRTRTSIPAPCHPVRGRNKKRHKKQRLKKSVVGPGGMNLQPSGYELRFPKKAFWPSVNCDRRTRPVTKYRTRRVSSV